jgi:hypothetical protein
MGRPFSQDWVFLWNLTCVLFDRDGFLAWDSFSRPWFGPISFFFFLDKVSILTKKETKQQQRARPNKVRLRRQSLKA